MKMVTVTRRGERLAMLRELALTLAGLLDEADPKSAPAIAKQYRETIREIEELKGGAVDDEIDSILAERDAAGKPGAVRKNRAKLRGH